MNRDLPSMRHVSHRTEQVIIRYTAYDFELHLVEVRFLRLNYEGADEVFKPQSLCLHKLQYRAGRRTRRLEV